MIDEENQSIIALDVRYSANHEKQEREDQSKRPVSKLSMTLKEKNIFYMGLEEVPLREKVASMLILMSIQCEGRIKGCGHKDYSQFRNGNHNQVVVAIIAIIHPCYRSSYTPIES
uniref:Uncharacterized protein n=1 Tax=Glossina austeni TaxID=7395 RepID=A0A1A9UXW4_GLOAU